jgi:hypothetical protein
MQSTALWPPNPNEFEIAVAGFGLCPFALLASGRGPSGT